MRIFVVMANDYPDSVFSTERDAEAYCTKQRDAPSSQLRRIYWRVYEFTLDKMVKV